MLLFSAIDTTFLGMAKKLLPKTFITTSIEHYTFLIRSRSKAIYLVIILGLCVFIAILPLTHIGIMTTAQGVVNTQGANLILQAPVTASLAQYYLQENQQIDQGDTLVIFETYLLDREITQIDHRIVELNTYLSDIGQLITNVHTESLLTATYLLAQQQYQSGLQVFFVKQNNASRTYQRQQKLYQQKVIPTTALQRDRQTLDLVKAKSALYTQQTLNTWKQEALVYEQDRKQLMLKKKQLENELNKYVLIAPGRGELQQVTSLTTGQLVQVGAKLAELSVDKTLLAICWVSPRDMGFLKKQMATTIRIDAFNANDWGSLRGLVASISSDVYLINNQPYFKVVCILEKDFLTLKNGFVGKLKKGMTLQASFQVTTRSLYQLLYDKVEDWLNPNKM